MNEINIETLKLWAALNKNGQTLQNQGVKAMFFSSISVFLLVSQAVSHIYIQ